VPEIDLPGHTNSALASYPELNRSEEAPPLYTQTAVGFSTLCTDMAITYKFLDDVIGELAALTPGPYIHIGGDEADATPLEEYLPFIERVQQIVHSHGKQVVGWEEVTHSRLAPGTLVQLWRSDLPKQAVAQGAKVILSPASRTYLDMKYDESWPLGLKWAGFVEVETAYDWEPPRWSKASVSTTSSASRRRSGPKRSKPSRRSNRCSFRACPVWPRWAGRRQRAAIGRNTRCGWPLMKDC
jgi:hexosaminidase